MTVPGTTASRLFQPDRLTIGLSLPLRALDPPQPDLRAQIEIAAQAEAAGFDAVWVRDVPLNGDWYPEAFGHPDPFVTLGAIAAATRTIAFGTAATVLTVRHPLHVAKAAISLDRLSGGRFVLGLGSGDRPQEFAAFEQAAEDRRGLFRSHWATLEAALRRPAEVRAPNAPDVDYDLRPSALNDIPRLAVGSSGQTLEWIAGNASGWATYHRPAEVQRDRHALWRRAVDQHAPDGFRSFSVAMGVDLSPDPDAPAEPISLGVRAGAHALASGLLEMGAAGAHHIMLNLAPTDGSHAQALDQIARHVLEPVKAARSGPA